jgi:TRAP-type mannitol/chloroaromatic compound transport system substrate-binding protein
MKRKNIDRRDLIKGAAGAAAVAGLAACGADPPLAEAPAVHTRPRIRWRLASSFPRALDTLFGAAEKLAARLEALSGGSFTLRCHPAGELVPPFEVLDATQQGTVQVGHTAGYFYTGKNPALAFDTGVPWGLTTRQQSAWMAHRGGLELMRELYAGFNIVNFPAGSTGAQMGGWFRQPVETLDDLRGLKMRIPGLGGQVMSRLGVTVQVFGAAEAYQALERGAIDAAEWVGPYDDEKLGFHKVASNYYTPGWWEPGPTLSFLVNKDRWQELPGEYREIFTSAAAEAGADMTARYDAVNPPALERLLAAGVNLRRFSDEILNASRRASAELYEELAAGDAAYRRVYEAWKTAREESFRWFDTTERVYADFAFPQG